MIRVLLWKEWHEQKYRCLIASIAMLILIVGGRMAQSNLQPQDLALIGVVLGIILIPIYMAMGLFAGEHTDRTMGLLASLPTPSWKVVASKLAVAVPLTILPFAVCALASAMQSRAGDPSEIPGRVIAGAMQACILLFWSVALGIHARSELRVALFGAAVLMTSAMALVVGSLLEVDSLYALLIPLPISPFIWLIHEPVAGLTLTAIALSQAAPSCGLICWCMWRWRREPWRRGVTGQRITSLTAEVPLSTSAGALAWREWMEHRMTVVAVLAMIFAIPALSMISWKSKRIDLDYQHITAMILTNIAGFLIGPITILIATTVTAQDLEPKVYDFWKSRPVALASWLFSRWVGGVVAWFIPLIIAGLAAYALHRTARDHNAYYGQEDALGLILLGIPMLLTLYAWSFWLGCFIRRVVIAAMASLAVGAVILIAPTWSSMQWLNPDDIPYMDVAWPYWRFFLIHFAVAAVGLALAWQTIRRDWTWQRLIAGR